jgi:hypothetical protein
MTDDLIPSLWLYFSSMKPGDCIPFRFIVLHHSATADGETVNWNAIRKYHMEVNGWKDIGYHFGVEKVGEKYQVMGGRTLKQAGSHAVGFNTSGIGVCMIGDFDNEAPPVLQWLKGIELCQQINRFFGHRLKIIGHRDTYEMLGRPVQKTCPGKMFDIGAFSRSV